MGQPADTISPVEQQDNLSAQASFDMEVDECGDDRQSRGQDDDSLSEVRANESGAGERSEGSRAPEGWSERVGTRKPGPRTRTAKESPRKQTPTRTRKLVSRKEPRIPSRTGNVTDQPNSEHMLEEELSDPPTESPVMTSGPCGASVEPQSTDDSDTAVAESDGHLRIATTSAVKLPGTSSGIPRRALSEESPSSPSSSSLTRRKESSRDVAGGKKKLATASGMRRTVSSSTTGSADEEPVTPRTKRTKIGKSPSATKSQRRARVEPREDSQEPNCAPSVAEALNTAWTANNNTSPISKTRRNSHTQVARDINAPVQVHGSTSHQEERRQPSLNSQEKEEYEKRIHDLESRLAAVEARDPKPMDQMFDVFVRRMKEAIPPPMSPQVYVTPIAVGSDCNAPFFVPTEPYGYRGNHVGASNFRSREPPRFPSHQANTYWQFSHHNNTRTGYGNRTQNVHHPNTGHYNRGQGFRGGGFQRGRRPGYGDYHNRERNNVALELSQRRYPSHWPTGPSDVYRHSGDTPSEVGSNDQHQHGGDTMNEPDEAHQEHTRESSPYEPVAETPASPENLNAGSDYGEGSRGASRSMNPLRPESDEHHWEDTYDQDNRVGDVNNKGDDQTRSGAVLNQIDVVNPWT
ncbi:hypothetical protein F5887DRAFT_305625 [Amanita rubescens]|nr:hypothetical protein F5887DRAFT_305625 [Amanita rubescens]